MILAAIGDISGPANALRAVLGAIAGAGVHTMLHTGNAAAGAGAPHESLTLLRGSGVVSVQGHLDHLLAKWERKRASLSKRMSAEECRAFDEAEGRLSTHDIEYLRALPRTRALNIDGFPILLCFGSPSSPAEVLSAESPLVKFQRQRESAADALLIVCGGAPAPFHRHVDGALFVGPGPLLADSGLARYTVIDTEQALWRVHVEELAIG